MFGLDRRVRVGTSEGSLSQINIAALVAYDGTGYFGFQYQPNRPTIQGSLEQGLAEIVQKHCRVTGSGRTDTGVHANGQVISAQVPWTHDGEALLRAWNAHLPRDIVVRQICLVPNEFHARFSAQSRTYSYRVYQSVYDGERRLVRRSPLTDRFSLLEHRALDMAQMSQASQYLVGKHDFITFGRPPQGNNSVRQVLSLDIREHELTADLAGLEGKYITFTIQANAFLRQMVRNIVGMLLEVGRNHLSPVQVKVALEACDRGRCTPPAPPAGLVLQHVGYPRYPYLFQSFSRSI